MNAVRPLAPNQSIIDAADRVQRASAGEPAALCAVYGHEEHMGWQSPDGDLGRLPEAKGPWRDAHQAVTYCDRCRRVWR